jgi:ring-1,2-phenylacetyl-CoA epoxidase subunit PaaD
VTAPTATATRADIRALLDGVTDPEIPVLTIADLGVLRDVEVGDDGHVEVTITPTYSGCPALDVIRSDVVAALERHGYCDVRVRTVLAPAWTTDWMTDAGRRKLADYGIAPPGRRRPTGPVSVQIGRRTDDVRCPRCGSADTRMTSRFGSTACKALFRCAACLEPFDYFKAI